MKNLIFTVLVPGTVGLWLPLWIAGRQGDVPGVAAAPARIAALLAVAAGGAIYLWCAWDFAVHGRGTPAPIDAPRTLVVRGPYRWVRNPMYVGVITMILGWWLYFGLTSLLTYGAVTALLMQLFVTGYEEPHLTRLFGDSYRAYCGRVRRWIPGRPISGPPPAA